MTKCRACLKSHRNMIPFDEKCIMFFNILTNLNLKVSATDPQLLCKHCLKTLKEFIEFRGKCIAANAEFSDINPNERTKQEDPPFNDTDQMKVKQELHQDELIRNVSFDDEMTDYCDEIDYEPKFDNNLTYELVEKSEPQEAKSEGNNIIYEKTTEKSVLPCGLCTKSLEDSIQLHSHILLTHKNYNSCSICDEKFEDWQELMAHRLIHLPQKRLQCHLCVKNFKAPLSLEHHFRINHHSEGERQTLRCRICNHNYKTPRRLHSHCVQTHNSKNKSFYCDYCNKLFISKANLKSHIVSHTYNRPFRCDLCDFSSRLKRQLQSHKIFKHNPNRAYCAKCKKVFVSKTEMDKHTCKHADAVCPVCGKILQNKNGLNVHLRTHDKDHWYKCDRCPAAFKGRTSLAVHKNKHDGIRKYECEFCHAKFFFSSVLVKHRRTHTGVKPFVCKVCQKGFTGNHNLKVHMRVHGKFLIKKKEPICNEALLVEYFASNMQTKQENGLPKS